MGIDEQYEAWLEGEAAAAQAEAENERNKPNLASTSTVLTDEEYAKLAHAIGTLISDNRYNLTLVPRKITDFIAEWYVKRNAHTRHQIAEWLEKWLSSWKYRMPDYAEHELESYIAKLKE